VFFFFFGCRMSSKTSWDSKIYAPDGSAHPVPHNLSYYGKCLVGGILSCGLTHTAVVPLDVVKCKMQVYPEKYKGLVQGVKLVVKEEGMAGLRLGWAPTLIGYSAQGAFKFGLYEFFKDVYSNLAGQDNAKKYKGVIWLAGSASAEVFADIALCPMEMVKVKVQTSPAGTWPTSLAAATQAMIANKADTRFPFGSVIPLWSRQVPYTMAKFYFFEKVVQLFYTHVFTEPKNTYSKPTQLGVTFASGYLAGIICAVVSHPADSLVSQLGKKDNKGKSLGQIINENGWANFAQRVLVPV